MAEFRALRAPKNYSSCEELARFAHKNFCFAHIHFFIIVIAIIITMIISALHPPKCELDGPASLSSSNLAFRLYLTGLFPILI